MDLNVDVIARWVDQLTGPAKASIKQITSLTAAVDANAQGSAQMAKAAEAAAKGTADVTKAAEVAAKATQVLTAATGAQTLAAIEALRVAQEQYSALSREARALNDVAAGAGNAERRIGLLERMQMRGQAAAKVFGSAVEDLNKKLMALAAAQIYIDGLGHAGHAIGGPLDRSIESAAAFSGGMTGFGITAELSDKQMAPIRDAILQAVSRLALAPETAQETFAFTRRSGVFRTVPEIISAGSEAARFQKLAERMGSPVSGEQVAGGASSAVREYGFAATPEAIRRFFAMIDAAEKTGGGMTMSELLEYARSSGGQMKALNFGNAAGLADVLAGQQLSMYLAHTGGQAGINFQDMLTQLAQPHTLRRYRMHGVDLEKAIKAGEARGISPVETVAAVTKQMTGGDRFRVGELMANQQATQAMLALMQNMDKFRAYSAQIRGAGTVGQYDQDVARVLNDQKTALERLTVAEERLGIATGTILLPAMTKVAGIAERVATWFTHAEEHGGLLAKAAIFAASGLAILMIGAAGIGHVILGILGPIWILQSLMGEGLAAAFTVATGAVAGFVVEAWAFTAALLANPITWVIAAVAALAVGAYLLIKNWSAVKAWFGGFWTWLTKQVSAAVAAVERLFMMGAPQWLSVVTGLATGGLPGAALAAAHALSQPPGAGPQTPPAKPRPPVVQHLTQNFHVDGGKHDTPTLAKHLHKLSRDDAARALHDGDSE